MEIYGFSYKKAKEQTGSSENRNEPVFFYDVKTNYESNLKIPLVSAQSPLRLLARLLWKSVLTHFQKFCRLIRRNASIQDFLDIPIHNLIQLIQGQVDPVIRYSSLGEIICPYLL